MKNFGASLHNIVRRDIGRKLIALVLAITSWMLIGSALEDERAVSFEVVMTEVEPPIELRGENRIYVVPGKDQILDVESVVSAEVTLVGTKGALEKNWHVSTTIDIRDDFCGDKPARSFLIDNTLIAEKMKPSALPTRDVRLEMKEAINIRVIQGVKGTIPLNPHDNLQIELSPGVTWLTELSEQVSLEPKSVTIFGPKDIVEDILKNPNLLKLEPLQIVSTDPTDIEQSLRLDTRNPRFEHVSFAAGSPRLVKVKVKQEPPRPLTKTITGLRIEPAGIDWFAENHGDLSRLQPAIESEAWLCDVVVSAPESVWGSIVPESLRDRIFLYVKLEHLGDANSQSELRVFASVHENSAGLPFPKGVKIDRLNTDQIHVWIDSSKDSEPKVDGG